MKKLLSLSLLFSSLALQAHNEQALSELHEELSRSGKVSEEHVKAAYSDYAEDVVELIMNAFKSGSLELVSQAAPALASALEQEFPAVFAQHAAIVAAPDEASVTKSESTEKEEATYKTVVSEDAAESAE